ncbi:MAG TPA: beta-propeller fold lactonase family protein [Actinophytocola sp.]|uniref:beta-propeller fold lactonase family protein n=1 Tax=Actinophytocola sp. TaxID=1872138 RepID=UPI002DDCCEE9|nr:beta-propeller fold lactonase family protein [Actinophytocola sp.]HEV2783680.1 beta-propeller fold lactonase family protein [Actinophytocola sp.]
MRAISKHAAIVLSLATALTVPAASQSAAEEGLTRPLLVAHRQSATVSTFAVTRDGRLTLLATGVPTGTGTRPIVVSPDGRFAFSAGRESNEIFSYAVARDGTLTPIFVIPGQDNFPYNIIISPDGRTLYVGNQFSDVISTYAIAANGSLSPRGPAIKSGALHTRVMSMTPDGRFLYVGHGDAAPRHPGVLTGFAVQPDGTLTPRVGPLSVGIAAGSTVITPDGRFLYVPGEESNQLFGFRIASDGALTPVPGSPYEVIGEHQAMAVTPDGRHLYMGDNSGDRIRAYTIAGDGALTEVPGSPFAAGDLPIGVTTSPDGRFLFMTNFNSHDIHVFAIEASGALTLTGPPQATGGMAPATRSTVFIPNKGPRARFIPSPRPAGQPTLFNATGSSDRDGRIARYDWNFGDGTTGPDAGPTPSHRYRQPGVYTVTLTVTDDEGCSTRLVYTGHVALCTGSSDAVATQRIIVR